MFQPNRPNSNPAIFPAGFLIFREQEIPEMASPTSKTEKVRARKEAPNKANRKTDKKLIRENLRVIDGLEGKGPR
jgi:hypothetical protein